MNATPLDQPLSAQPLAALSASIAARRTTSEAIVRACLARIAERAAGEVDRLLAAGIDA